jgi:hypothetical protein
MEMAPVSAPSQTNRPAPAAAPGATEWAETMRAGNLEFYGPPDEHYQKPVGMYQKPEEQPLMDAPGRKKVFGLRPKIAWLLLLGLILVLAAIVVGVAVGVTHKKHSGSSTGQ